MADTLSVNLLGSYLRNLKNTHQKAIFLVNDSQGITLFDSTSFHSEHV